MTLKNSLNRLLQLESLNFVLTNRLPRVTLTRWMGRISKVRHPLVRVPALAAFRFFASPDLSEADKQQFDSLHDCFIRAIRPGARSFVPDTQVLCSPSDGVVGAFGPITGDSLLQIKGMAYSLRDLLGNDALAQQQLGGNYLTLRLRAGMYHRFHAPSDLRVSKVTHIQGDTWNVNPPALKRVPGLYCRNDRAIIETRLTSGQQLTLVPVGAILVASVRLHCLGLNLSPEYVGLQQLECDAPHARGQEMGWFEHGSTIIVLTQADMRIHPRIRSGLEVRAGEALMELLQKTREPANPA